MSNFSKSIKEFSDKFGEDLSTVIKKASFGIFRDTILATPVDTGRASQSWNIMKNGIDPTVPVKGTYPARSAIEILSDVSKLGKIKDDDKIYISSSLSYIEPLERGHSRQAPSGMLTISVNRWNKYINDAVKDTK